jgi:hypothetical protein
MEVTVSLIDIFEDFWYACGPARYVGRRYRFSTNFDGKSIIVSGIISNFIRSESRVHYYSATGKINTLIQVTSLVKRGSDWEVIVSVGDGLNQVLIGKFWLI